MKDWIGKDKNLFVNITKKGLFIKVREGFKLFVKKVAVKT
jgi:hypothetical protein